MYLSLNKDINFWQQIFVTYILCHIYYKYFVIVKVKVSQCIIRGSVIHKKLCRTNLRLFTKIYLLQDKYIH